MEKKKLLLVTDAWHPQVNGVVMTYSRLVEDLEREGWTVNVVHPGRFFTISLPFYPEIHVSILPRPKVRKILEKEQYDHVHIATEGPLGWAARSICKSKGLCYTTHYFTHFDAFLDKRIVGLGRIVSSYLKRFHAGSSAVMVPTESLKYTLERKGYNNVRVWKPGVDTSFFSRATVQRDSRLQSPVFLYFGRLAPEKDVDTFLELNLPGSKLVIGDGPSRKSLEATFGNHALFLGTKRGAELVEWLSQVDVLVFPSRTDTFGLVIVEALACGIPVAAFNVAGPRDIITNGVDGVLDENLAKAATAALLLDRAQCRKKAEQYSWSAALNAFHSNLVEVRETMRRDSRGV